MSEQEQEEFEVPDPVDTSVWDDAMYARSVALLKHDLGVEDPDSYAAGPDYER